MINEVNNAAKIAGFFVFLCESYFLLGHFYFKCHLKSPFNGTQENVSKPFITKDFHYKYFYKRPKYCKFIQKRNKVKHVMKKDHYKR